MDWLEQVKTRLTVAARKDGRFSGIGTSLGGLLAVALFLAPGGQPAQAASSKTPDASDVLRLVRANESQQSRDFTGRLRMSKPTGKLLIPFHLSMRNGTITYQFSEPSEALVLRLGEKGSRLERVTGSGRSQTIAGAKLDGLVRGSDITYEDLALKFLYWANAKVVDQDSMMTRPCWVVQAVPSGKGESQYDLVRLWVEKNGGLMKAECYIGDKLSKRFEVRGVQRASEGGYLLKTMRIERMDEKGKALPPTYLEIRPE